VYSVDWCFNGKEHEDTYRAFILVGHQHIVHIEREREIFTMKSTVVWQLALIARIDTTIITDPPCPNSSIITSPSKSNTRDARRCISRLSCMQLPLCSTIADTERQRRWRDGDREGFGLAVVAHPSLPHIPDTPHIPARASDVCCPTRTNLTSYPVVDRRRRRRRSLLCPKPSRFDGAVYVGGGGWGERNRNQG
jgi:hypothetical protein